MVSEVEQLENDLIRMDRQGGKGYECHDVLQRAIKFVQQARATLANRAAVREPAKCGVCGGKGTFKMGDNGTVVDWPCKCQDDGQRPVEPKTETGICAICGEHANEHGAISHTFTDASPPVAPRPADAEGRCPYCDNTGDVHRADGEYLGKCEDCSPATPPAMSDEVREACRVGAASLRGDLAYMKRVMGGDDYKQRSAWKQIAKHEATLRRLAEQGKS